MEKRAREALANPDDDVAWETVRAELHSDPAGLSTIGFGCHDLGGEKRSMMLVPGGV